MKSAVPYFILALVSMMGLLLLGSVTQKYNVAVVYDSAAYLGAAENILAGKGYTEPFQPGVAITHWPPLFPLSLALISWISGLSVLNAARFLNISLFAGMLFLIGLSLKKWTKSLAAALLGMFFLLCHRDMISLYASAYSEPLFHVLGILGLLLLACYFSDSRKGWALFAGSVCIGLAFGARYMGGWLVITGWLMLLTLGQRGIREKMRSLAIFTVFSCLPIFLFFIRNHFRRGQLTSRSLGFHPPPFEKFLEVISALVISA